jgi:FdhE protein
MPAPAGDWDERIARARRLALDNTAARDLLTFYAALAEYQQSLVLTAGSVHPGADFADAIDINAAASGVPGFLAWLHNAAPAPLAAAAATIRIDLPEWKRLMHESLTREDLEHDADVASFVIDAVLQPFAEAAAVARRENAGFNPNRSSRCPVCSALPGLGVLRPEGQGAKRMLLCGRCLTEWEYLRVVCTSCGEQEFERLPVYTADAFPHVRLEACDTCKRYLKTIDLTKDGHAVPVVDDIASVTLDLWAGEQGYRRLRPNLLRTTQPAPPGPFA